MKSRLGICLLALTLAISILFSGCGGKPSSPAVGVSLTASTSTLAAGSSPAILTATVANDTSNAGVKWILTPSSGCGSLGSGSGTTATYTPPTESSLNADCTATINATSVADSSKSGTTALTVKAIAITLPAGETTIPTAALGEASLPLSALIASGTDASGSATLNWSITGSSASILYGGVSRAAFHQSEKTTARMQTAVLTSICGSLSGSTGTSVTYTPSSSPCTDTVTVSTSVNPNVSTSFTIAVNPTLTISTSSLGQGTYGTSYATSQLQASGGVGSYTWQASNLPPGLTLTAAGILSGTPTAAGPYSVAVTATDSNSNQPYTTQQSLPLTVSRVALPVTVTAASKPYDGTATATITNCTLTGVLPGDTGKVSCAATSAAFSDANVGTGKTVTATGISLGGTAAANYQLSSTTATTTASITALPVTATVTAASKPYDGTTTATITGCTLTGVLPGDAGNVSCAATAASFSDPSAGSGKTVTATGISLNGTAANKYQLSSPTATTTATITPLSVTVALGVASKTYDGTTNAVLQSCTVNGVLAADTGNVACGVVGASYSDPNVGTGKTVTVTGINLSGPAAVDYQLPSSTATTTANISPASLTVTAANATKVYGQADPSYTAIYTGFVSSDTSSVVSGSPSLVASGTAGVTRPAGSYTITPSVGSLTATNYTFSTFVAGTLTVTKAPVTAIVTAVNKSYDGTTTAGISNCTVNNLLNGDTVTCVPTAANFSDASAGTNKTVTATGISLSGTAATNYQLSSNTATTTANITALPVTASVTANSKTYDGTTTATLSGCTLTGVLVGDTSNVGCSATSAAFSDATAGTGKTVTATGISLSGAAAVDYQLSSATATTTANINAASLTVTAGNATKVYGQADPTTYTANYTGFVNGENSSVVSGLPAFSVSGTTSGTARPAGTYTITPSAGSLTATNYTFSTFNPGTLTVTAQPVTATVTASDKTYDGTATATITNCTVNGLQNGDSVTCSATAAAFSDANAAAGKTVTATGISLSGAAMADYQLSATTATATATINQAPLTVTANNITWAQGGTWPPAYTASYSGFVNGENPTVLSGAPTLSSTATSTSPVGTYPITVLQNTLAAANYSFTFQPGTLTIVAAPLSITTISLPNGISGTFYSQQLNATGGTLPIQWSVTSGAPPAGITLSSGGLLSGTTSLSGPFSFTVQAQDSGSGAQQQTKTQALSITINPALVISTASLPSGNTGMAYSQQLAASGGVGNINWSVTAGTLPAGITLSSGGLLSGSTTLSGPFNFTVQAQDSGTPQQTATQALSLTINPAIYVTLSPNTQQNLDVGGTLPITPTVSNDANNKGVNFTLSPLTGCGSIAPSSNVASGTPVTYTAPASLSNPCQVTVTATSISDNTKTAQLTINVNLPLTLPPSSPDPLPSATVGAGYNGAINVSGGTGPYSWTIISGLPADGLTTGSLNGSTLTITGMPTTAQAVTFTAQVQDATGAQVSQTYSITVNSPTPLTLPPSSPDPLPSGAVGISYNGGINASGGVPGYTFTVNSNTIPTNGSPVSLTNGLTVSNTGGNSLIVGGTPTAVATVTLSVSVTDSTNATFGPMQYTINVVNPTPLTINTTQKDIGNGGVGLPYSAWIDVSGGSGNSSNYVFTTASGSLPPGLAWSTTCNSCIVGTPTTTGSYPFTVKVTDSTIPGSQATQSYTILISNGPDGSKNQYLYGRYTFLFQGFVDNPNGGSPISQTAAIGSFKADGNGGISGGQFVVNDGIGGNNGNGSSSNGFSGTYSIGSDNRGVITLANTCISSSGCYANNTANSISQQFVFSVGQIENLALASGTCPKGGSNSSCPLYTDGRMVEFDDVGATPSGVHGEAHLFKQRVGSFNTLTNFQTSVAGNWVFGFEGEDITHSPLAVAGVATLQIPNDGTTVSGTIPSGTTDINDNQVVVNKAPLSGSDTFTSVATTTNTGMFNGTLTVPSGPTGYPTNYQFFMISANRMVGMSWDSHSTNSLASGIFYKQPTSITSMPSAAVMYMSGLDGGGSAHAQLLQMTCSGGTCTVNSDDDNDAGTYTQNQNPPAGTQVTAAVAANGRVTLTGAGNHPPIFYLYDSSSTGGGVMLNTGSVELGNLFAQGIVPSTVSALAGSYYMGDLFSMDPNSGGNSGVVTLDNSGNVSGTSDSGGQQYTDYAQSLSGATIPSINSYGVFDIEAGGLPQIVCYLINPVCSGGGTSCGGSGQPPYATYACIGPQDNNPRVTLVQQVP